MREELMSNVVSEADYKIIKWFIGIFVSILFILLILNIVNSFQPAETGERITPPEKTMLYWYSDSIIIHFQELDSTEELKRPYTDTLQLWNTIDTLWLDSIGVLERFPDYYKIPEFKPEIIYPEPEPKIINI